MTTSISLFSYLPDQDRENEILWGSEDGYKASLQRQKEQLDEFIKKIRTS